MESHEEGCPFLQSPLGIAVYGLLAIVAATMVVFSAVPSIFFGYRASTDESITRMTHLASSVGAVCMSMNEFESTVIDAFVTSIAAEYTEQGISIDHIEVVNSFDEESLLWLTAIHSVAHAQNLEEMSADELRELCKARMSYAYALFGKDEVTLRVEIDKLDPNEWMEQLGFSDEARTWAGALFEVLSESDAINKYGSGFFDAVDHSGDGGYSGAVQHGGSYGSDIDTSYFLDPSTKNAHDLAAYAVQAWENNWGYTWGTFGNLLTPSMLEYKASQYPDGVGKYRAFIETHYLNRRTADCIGLVKSYGWFNPETGGIDYGSNGMPDYSANQMYRNALAKGAAHGTIATMPDTPGLVLWKEGHTGVYIGGGYAVEAMSTSKGVCKTEVAGRGWLAWYELPYIRYSS